MVRNVMIPLIPKEEQVNIAERLDIVNEIIVKRKAQLEELDTLIKSRFKIQKSYL